jgi:hypothetical protein
MVHFSLGEFSYPNLGISYFDEYWFVIFIFDAARRIVAKEITTAADALTVVPRTHLSMPLAGIGTAVKSDEPAVSR